MAESQEFGLSNQPDAADVSCSLGTSFPDTPTPTALPSFGIPNAKLSRRGFLKLLTVAGVGTAAFGTNIPETQAEEVKPPYETPFGEIQYGIDRQRREFKVLTLDPETKILAFGGIERRKVFMITDVGPKIHEPFGYIPYPLLNGPKDVAKLITFVSCPDITGKSQSQQNMPGLGFARMDYPINHPRTLFYTFPDQPLTMNVHGQLSRSMIADIIGTTDPEGDRAALNAYVQELAPPELHDQLAEWIQQGWKPSDTDPTQYSVQFSTNPSLVEFMLANKKDPIVHHILTHMEFNPSMTVEGQTKLSESSLSAVGGLVVNEDGTYELASGGEFMCHALQSIMEGKKAVMQYRVAFDAHTWAERWKNTRVHYHEYKNSDSNQLIQRTQMKDSNGYVTVENWDMFVTATIMVQPDPDKPGMEIWFSGEAGANTLGDLVDEIFTRSPNARVCLPDMNILDAIPYYEPELYAEGLSGVLSIGPGKKREKFIEYPFMQHFWEHFLIAPSSTVAEQIHDTVVQSI